MKVHVDYNALRRFKRYASRKYPNEVFGILLGHKFKNFIVIKDIHIPKIKESAYAWVIPDYEDVDRIISEHHLTHLGDIHSHPNYTATPSEGDYQTWDVRETPIMGILSIRKRAKYKTTELTFWQKHKACPIKYRVKKF